MAAEAGMPRAALLPKGETRPAEEPTKKGYLMWDAGFGVRFACSLALLCAGGVACARIPAVWLVCWQAYQEVLYWLMEGANRMAWWSVIGLLSSSCCALQLMLNALNFGCAGFNTVLGPVRPQLCALTVSIQCAVWYTALDKPFQWLYLIPCTLLAALLTFLPELVYLRTRRLAAAPEGAPVGASRAILSVEGMGCVACTSKITEVLRSAEAVLSAEVNLERKEASAVLAIDARAAENELVPLLLKEIEEAGFEASLKSVVAERAAAPAPTSREAAADVAAVSMPGDCCATGVAGGGGGLPLSVATGLLSSSCCLLQLGANLLATFGVASVGCAGFNKILGPWRTHMRALTGLWLALSWGAFLARGQAQKPAFLYGRLVRLALHTGLCLSLTFLPEALVWAGGPALAPPTQGAEVLRLKVDGMGCEACQAHVQGVLGRAGGVVSSHVDWQKGHAELLVNREWAFDFEAVSRQLLEDGYEASLASEL